jgi:hypothetical protein
LEEAERNGGARKRGSNLAPPRKKKPREVSCPTRRDSGVILDKKSQKRKLLFLIKIAKGG